jgi:hypothetical protein
MKVGTWGKADKRLSPAVRAQSANQHCQPALAFMPNIDHNKAPILV